MKKTATGGVPRSLSSEARRLWREIVAEYALEDAAGLAILRTSLEAHDRMALASAQIAKEGTSFRDRFGQIKAHPMLVVERDARAAFLAGLKQLNLDIEPLRDRAGRPGGR